VNGGGGIGGGVRRGASTYVIQVDDTRDYGEVAHITCRICGRTSYNPQDVQMKYCANCDLMHTHNRGRTQEDVAECGEITRLHPSLMQLLQANFTLAELGQCVDMPVNWQRDGF
tara:strand:+ start:1887 stop:2228 length:342 start_codon:yes stop_codon:yes gene_type:complete